MEKVGLMSALLKVFGKKPGQSNTEFMNEVRQLTAEDKTFFVAELKKLGYDCTLPS
jgi:hypothetical protein